MEWLEANPLPDECMDCKDEDCYNCDYAGKRWYLSEEDKFKLQNKALQKAAERLRRKIVE